MKDGQEAQQLVSFDDFVQIVKEKLEGSQLDRNDPKLGLVSPNFFLPDFWDLAELLELENEENNNSWNFW